MPSNPLDSAGEREEVTMTERDGGKPAGAWTREIEILRDVLRAPERAGPEAVENPQGQPILEAYLGQVFEGIAVVAPDGRLRLFTPGLEHITGYRQDEVGSVAELIMKLAPDPETGTRQWAAFEDGLGMAESQEQLIEIVNKRGEHRWLRGRLYRVNEDTLVHVLDITAIHTLRGTTPHNAEHYQALLENLGVGIYSCDAPAKGTLSYTNPAFRNILGFPEDLAPGDGSAFMLYERPEDRVKLLRSLMADGFTHSRTVRFETRVLRVDDRRPVPVRATATVTYDEHGGMCRIDGALEDLSERERFEAARREHALLVSSLFEDTAVGIAIGTLDEKFLAVNPAFCEMLGYTEDELLGHPNDLVTHPEDRAITGQQIRSALARGRRSFTFRKRYCRKDGSVFTAELTMAGVNNADGELVAGIAVVEPVDEGG
jgi:PAS domain S-box-containing protein